MPPPLLSCILQFLEHLSLASLSLVSSLEGVQHCSETLQSLVVDNFRMLQRVELPPLPMILDLAIRNCSLLELVSLDDTPSVQALSLVGNDILETVCVSGGQLSTLLSLSLDRTPRLRSLTWVCPV